MSVLSFLRKPAVLTGHLEKLRAGIGRGERNLDAEHVEFLRETNRVLNRLLRFDRQTQNERAVNDHARLVAGLGEAAHFVHRHALLDAREDVVVARFVTDQEQAQTGVLELFNRIVIEVGAAVAGPGQAKRREFLGDFASARQVRGKGIVIEEEFRLLAGTASSRRPFHRRHFRASARGICVRRSSAATGRSCIAPGNRVRCRG